MPVLLKNVKISTARSVETRASGRSAPPVTYLEDVDAHMGPTIMNAFHVLPAGAMESDFTGAVEQGTDIQEGDIVTSVMLPDGVTTWPGLGLDTQTIQTLHVSYVLESAAGPLSHRRLYIKRTIAGGPPS